MFSPQGLTAGQKQQFLPFRLRVSLRSTMKKAVRNFNSYGFFGIEFNRLITDMIGAQEGTRTPTKLLAST